jgi:predicted transcriptional regulator
MKKLLDSLPFGTRGCKTRKRIINAIKDQPSNINQIAGSLDMDYKTISYHIKILRENGLITSGGNGYGAVYFLSDEMETEYGYFEDQLFSVEIN